jgi:hypothetical protein
MEHRLRQFRGLGRIERVLDPYMLSGDVSPHFADVQVGLGKML